MRATVIVENLSTNDSVKNVSKKLSEIEGLKNITIDKETSRASFTYSTDNQALAVLEKLRLLGHPCVEDKRQLKRKTRSYTMFPKRKLAS